MSSEARPPSTRASSGDQAVAGTGGPHDGAAADRPGGRAGMTVRLHIHRWWGGRRINGPLGELQAALEERSGRG